jgi:hypothetical protein
VCDDFNLYDLIVFEFILVTFHVDGIVLGSQDLKVILPVYEEVPE